MTTTHRWSAVAVALALLTVACTGGSESSPAPATTEPPTDTTAQDDTDPTVTVPTTSATGGPTDPADVMDVGLPVAPRVDIDEVIVESEGFVLAAGTTDAEQVAVEEFEVVPVTDDIAALTSGSLSPGISAELGADVDGAFLLTLPVAAPPSDDAVPGVLHVHDDGSFTVIPAMYDDDTQTMTVWIRSFSDSFGGWWNPLNWAEETIQLVQGGFDFVADWVTGRTDPPHCNDDPPDWAWVATQESSSLHVCVQSNNLGDGTERVEVFLKSNRSTMQSVTVPAGVDYLWVEHQPDWFRSTMSLITGDLSIPNGQPLWQQTSQTVSLFGGESMSFGFRRPAVDGDYEVRSYQSEIQIVANQLLGVMGGLDFEPAMGVVLAAYACVAEVTGINLPSVTGPVDELVEWADFAVKCALELISNPELLYDVVREVVDAAGLDGDQAAAFVKSKLPVGATRLAKAFAAAINVGGAVTRAWDGIFDSVAEGQLVLKMVGDPEIQRARIDRLPVDADPAIMLVVDVSGSMADTDNSGRIKIAGAKGAVNTILSKFDSSVDIGLLSYPNDGDCGVGGPIAPLGTDRDSIDLRMRSLQADGGTPTAAALREAARTLREHGGSVRPVIILISDGASNCDLSPCEVAADIEASGIDIRIDTIGFDISSSGAAELQCISETTGGRYREADNADELADELQRLAVGELALRIDAPDVVRRTVGRAASREVTIAATVASASSEPAQNVRVRIANTGDRQVSFVRPIRALGNLGPDDTSRTVEFTFAVPSDFETLDVSFEIVATADNAPPVSASTTVNVSGAISLDDAGPLLADAQNVVILGDSYSSGEGAGVYFTNTTTRENPCHRSPDTYGKDLWESRTIIACSGAVVADFYGAQYDEVSAQFEALQSLDQAPDLALLTIGGNDVDFRDIIIDCLGLGDCHTKRVVERYPCSLSPLSIATLTILRDVYGPGCYIDRGSYAEMRQRDVEALRSELVNVYLNVDRVLNSAENSRKRNGRDAATVVLAYPLPIPSPDRYGEILSICPDQMSFEEWTWISQFHAQLTGVIRDAVAEARSRGALVYFAEQTADAFQPIHTLCDDERYINYIDVSDTIDGVTAAGFDYILPGWLWTDLPQDLAINEQFHPNASGYRAMTAALVDFSNSPAAEPLDRDLRLDDVSIVVAEPLAETTTIALAAESVDTVLVRGATTRIEIDGFDPGTGVKARMASTPHVIDTSIANADGLVVIEATIPDDFELGPHTLSVQGVSDGQRQAIAWPVVVEAPPSWWYHWSPRLAIVGLALAVLALIGIAWSLLRRRRRPPPLASAGGSSVQGSQAINSP